MAILLPVLVAAAFLLGRHLQRRQAMQYEISPVSRQHIDLFQGGELNEAAVEAAKVRFGELLETGDVAGVEASLRPGIHYVIHVRALAELGSDTAGRILERQLRQRLTDDQLEQSWYWIDLANGLRNLNRPQSLPQVLQCAETAGELPLGHFFAAETVCFMGFAGYLRQVQTPLGRSALRTLQRALEGLRCGVQPHLVAEARLGDMVEQLWDHRAPQVDPLVARIFAEALRLLRRAPHAETCFSGEASEQEAFNWQLSRLAALEPAFIDYLQEAPSQLCKALAPQAGEPAPLDRRGDTARNAPRPLHADEQRDVLLALADLRADAGAAVLPLLAVPQFTHAELAVEVLAWSRDPRVGPYLREWAARRVPMLRRARRRRQMLSRRGLSVPDDVPYRAILRALRGHPARETEEFLVLAAQDSDPTYRAAAVSSLGWWEPELRQEVLRVLQEGRRDPHPEVRQAARAALARLGERLALQWFRQILTSEDPQRVHEALQVVAGEGLVLLWPDLDRLADSEDPDVARHCRETLERLSEEMGERRT